MNDWYASESGTDYSSGQVEAASRTLIELCSLFEQYEDDIRLVGGWVPYLMFPNSGHVGSLDVDLLINHLTLKEVSYETIEKILLRNGYHKHPKKFFTFIRRFEIEGVSYDVDVDILAGMYGGTTDNRRSQHVQGIKALKATAGNFAFEFKPQMIPLEAVRPDGAMDHGVIRVVGVVPFLVMKTKALGRGKAKDAYDIYFVIRNFPGGVEQLAKEFEFCKERALVLSMKEKLAAKFASELHAGPVDVAEFMNPSNREDISLIRRDVFERVQALIQCLEG